MGVDKRLLCRDKMICIIYEDLRQLKGDEITRVLESES